MPTTVLDTVKLLYKLDETGFGPGQRLAPFFLTFAPSELRTIVEKLIEYFIVLTHAFADAAQIVLSVQSSEEAGLKASDSRRPFCVSLHKSQFSKPIAVLVPFDFDPVSGLFRALVVTKFVNDEAQFRV